MIIEHHGHRPKIDETVYIAPNATVCGQVTIGRNTRIMFGAQLIAESSPITIGDHCIVLENAVIRGTHHLPVMIGNHCLIGPHAHLAGCIIEDQVFLATGVSVFHGARIKKGAEIRVNGVVHLKTLFPENETLPIGWIAVGNPMKVFPPNEHEELWKIQKALNFPSLVYDIPDRKARESLNRDICETMAKRLAEHRNDKIVE